MPQEFIKTWKITKAGAFAGFCLLEKRLDVLPLVNSDAIRFVAENNWLRRFLYWIGAPRWMTRRV